MNLFNLFKPKKLISSSTPYSYFAILNTLINIGKEHGKIHSYSDIRSLVYLICGLYSGYYKKQLINEHFFVYLPGIVLTNRYYNYFMNNKTPNHNLYTKYIKINGYVELIDKKCEDYKFVQDTYKFLLKYTEKQLYSLEIQLYSLVSYDYIKLKDGTILNCPVKAKLIEEGYEKFYDEKYIIRHPDYHQKVMEELILLKPYLDSNYISKYYSYWLNDNNDEEENNNIKIEEPEILD